MYNLYNLTRKSLFSVAALAGLAGASGAAACEPTYRTVTRYVTVQQPIAKYITRYDECGDAYLVKLVTYRTVTVPVTQVVRSVY